MITPGAQTHWNGWGPRADSLAARESFWRWLTGELGMPALLATPPRPLDGIALPPPRLPAETIAAFARLVGPLQLRQDIEDRARHARGRSYNDLLRLRAGDLSSAPDAVIYPRREEEVLAILKLAAERRVPVVPYGGGTSMAGGVTAAPGWLSLDISEMTRLTVLDLAAGTVTAQAGIGMADLEKFLNARGLTLGSDVACERATAGGAIASGALRDGFCGARLATARGVHAFDNDPVPGPDLKALIPGSEGVLGVITQATLKIRTQMPAQRRLYLLRDFASGLALAGEAMRQKLNPLELEVFDGNETRFLRRLMVPEKGRSFLASLADIGLALRGFKAGAASLQTAFADKTDTERMDALVKRLGGIARNAQAGWEWRQVRQDWLYYRDSLLDRGVGMEMLETAASWNRLPALSAAVSRALKTAMQQHAPRPGGCGLALRHVHHAGPRGARLTFIAIFPRLLNAEMEQAEAIRKAGLGAIRDKGGAIGLGGVGEDFLPWAAQGKNAANLILLRALKQSLDPENILNPGKLIPP